MPLLKDQITWPTKALNSLKIEEILGIFTKYFSRATKFFPSRFIMITWFCNLHALWALTPTISTTWFDLSLSKHYFRLTNASTYWWKGTTWKKYTSLSLVRAAFSLYGINIFIYSTAVFKERWKKQSDRKNRRSYCLGSLKINQDNLWIHKCVTK